jgi:hypothetical protein
VHKHDNVFIICKKKDGTPTNDHYAGQEKAKRYFVMHRERELAINYQ